MLKLLVTLSKSLGKMQIRSGLTVLLLFVYQSLFAQVTEIEDRVFAYSDFLVVMLIILIATIFIGMEILSDPKYESLNPLQNKSQIVSGSFVSTGYVFEKKVTTKLKIAIFSAAILLIMYAVLVFFMF